MPELVSPEAHAEFQYSSARHQADTALSGMWLFIATEVLIFGALVFVWLVYHRGHPAGFRLGAEHANLLIGSINTAVLVSSSFAFSWGVREAQAGRNEGVARACAVTALLGLLFLGLKGLEWHEDFSEHLLPGPGFGPTGPDANGAQIFFLFYFVATGLHGVHMIIGLGLVGWIAWKARKRAFTRAWHTPVQVVGIYWSFVDIVWLTLYPLIYVIGRTT